MLDNQKSYSIYRDISKPVIICHHTKEVPFISIPHLHSQYEIYYNVKGGKSFFVNNHFYRCEPHTIFLIPHTSIHKVIAEKNMPYERCILNIDAKIIHSLSNMPNMEHSRLHWLIHAGEENHPQKLVLDSFAHHVFLNLIDTYVEKENSLNELNRMIYLLQILDFLEEQSKQQKEIPIHTVEPTTLSDKVIRYVEENLTEKITIKKISSELFVHENYLSTRFKEETDMTVNQYLVLRRIAEAKKHLYHGCSVKEAGLLAGFQNYSNFIRTFKNKEGYPPGKLSNLTTPL